MMKETDWKVIKKDGVAKMFDGSLSDEGLKASGYEIMATGADRGTAQNIVNELNSSFHQRGETAELLEEIDTAEEEAREADIVVGADETDLFENVDDEEDENDDIDDEDDDEICEDCGEYLPECICDDEDL